MNDASGLLYVLAICHGRNTATALNAELASGFESGTSMLLPPLTC